MSSDCCPYCNARFEIKAVAFPLKGASVIRTCPHCALVSVTTSAVLPQSIGSDRDAYKFGQARRDTVAPLIAARADARRPQFPVRVIRVVSAMSAASSLYPHEPTS